MKIPRPVFRFIEHELYTYEDNKQEIEAFKKDTVESSPSPDTTGIKAKGSTSDPTGAKAMKLLTSKAIISMEQHTRAIDKAFNRLSEDHRQLYELKYNQAMNWQTVCDELPTSQSTYFRIRKELVVMVGLEMGLVKYFDI